MEKYDDKKLENILAKIPEPKCAARCAGYIWLKAKEPKYSEQYIHILLHDLAENGSVLI
jgi:hypothetical protein